MRIHNSDGVALSADSLFSGSGFCFSFGSPPCPRPGCLQVCESALLACSLLAFSLFTHSCHAIPPRFYHFLPPFGL